ncbi:hypothetical protein [Marivita sp. S2033]|uniref:hypothetical protein n=1 Tax=Marivita sp. S2033 TaxID=3373187 RepID=UPI0039824C22
MIAMLRRTLQILTLGAFCTGHAQAQSVADDRHFSLSAPPALIDSGLLKHLIPRFSLKTRIRIALAESDSPTHARFGGTGTAVFNGLDQLWHFQAGPDPDAERFAEWLVSDVGRKTIESFQPNGRVLFAAAKAVAETTARAVLDGDAARGEVASFSFCGRCHVVGEKNRMNSIGSTPSFAVLRTLRDWQERFETFYVQNPHPAFTQIADLTPPFDPTRPSPIRAMEITLTDLENILAFVQTIPPAELGRPVQTMQD